MGPSRASHAALTLFIGIDLGTSGCRACAIDAAGLVRAGADTPLPEPRRAHPASEQDPGLWWTAVNEVLHRLLQQIPAERVRALAVDGTSSTLLLTDADGTPLTPGLMYDDRRSRDEAEAIAAVAPPDSPARGAGSSLAKLLHLYRRCPGARHGLHQADWISGMLCGRFGISDENNCLKLGFDPVGRRWPAWLRHLDLPPTLLPKVVAPGTVIGTVAAGIGRRLGLSDRTRVVAGTTDSTAALLATGACRPGDAVTSLGSTLVLKVVSERPVSAPEYGVYSHRLGDLWLAGGASNSGGRVLLQYFSRHRLEELTPRLRAEQDSGLDYYPLPDKGERFPLNDPELTSRLRPRPRDPVRFFQGMLEGMARIEARGYRLLADLGAPFPTSVRSVGGGAANPAWRIIRARTLGVAMIEPPHREAAYGAALLARRGAAADGDHAR